MWKNLNRKEKVEGNKDNEEWKYDWFDYGNWCISYFNYSINSDCFRRILGWFNLSL
jgi:hypothetical protein